MSHKKSDTYDSLIGFQRTMYRLTTERYPDIYSTSKIGPPELAKILYNDYYDFVAPRGYAKKHSEYKERNIAAIKKQVERHYLKENPWDISSKYMYAYSQIFHVSMDFLYGNTEIFSDDYDTKKICEKTGLSEKAVEHLLSDEEVYICDFANSINEDYDSERVIHFWDMMLKSDLYKELPENYFRMACSFFLYNLCKQDEKNLFVPHPSLPPEEEFIDIVNAYSYSGKNVFIPNGLTLEEAYDKDKHWALNVIQDIINEQWSEANERLKQIESIYWGCSGQFNRFIEDYFQKQSSLYKINLCNNTPNEEF